MRVLLPTAYVGREEVIFSVSLSVHISGGGGEVPIFQMVGGGGVPTQVWMVGAGGYLLRSGWGGLPSFPGWRGTYSGLDGGGATYLSRLEGYLLRSGWGGGYLPFQVGGVPTQVWMGGGTTYLSRLEGYLLRSGWGGDLLR